jgi:hypothetical protein
VTTAKETFFAIKDACHLRYMPTRKRIVPELQHIGMTQYGEVLFKRWCIIVSIKESTIAVLAVLDSSRNIEDILFQRLMKPYQNLLSI